MDQKEKRMKLSRAEQKQLDAMRQKAAQKRARAKKRAEVGGASPEELAARRELLEAVLDLYDGNRSALGVRLDVDRAAVSKWALGKKPVPAHRVDQLQEILEEGRK